MPALGLGSLHGDRDPFVAPAHGFFQTVLEIEKRQNKGMSKTGVSVQPRASQAGRLCTPGMRIFLILGMFLSLAFFFKFQLNRLPASSAGLKPADSSVCLLSVWSFTIGEGRQAGHPTPPRTLSRPSSSRVAQSRCRMDSLQSAQRSGGF